MAKLNFISRLITVLCYFLPVTFFYFGCNGLSSEIAYNKHDVFNIIIDSKQSVVAVSNDTSLKTTPISIADSLKQLPENAKDSIISEELRHDTTGKKDFLARVISPVNHSLSAIGVIVIYKTVFGKIVICASMVISLFLLFGIRLIRRNEKLIMGLSIINVACVLLFVIDSYSNKVDLLWGAWVLLCSVLISFIIQKFSFKKNQAMHSQ
ncbi:MAG: hypothetical protein HYR66_06605 [Sphingobacteriales bacterium]|nr:hypothetical protein [Sphingobacteriales bacterium]MBI3717395.1 hypothetical protein [Sphingobacteriales bacterium]